MLTSRTRTFRQGPLLRLTLCLGLSCLWPLGRASSASAQPDAAEPAVYGALIEQAFAEYEAGHFPEARALFSRANAVFTNARVLRSLGMVEFELRNYRDSAALLERALASQVEPLSFELQNETRQLLDRAHGFLVRLHLSVEPSTTSVSIDGGPAHVRPEAPLIVEAGDHTLLFRAPGFVPETRVLKARGGDEQTWHVLLSAAAEPAAGSATSVPPLTQVSTDSAADEAPRDFIFVVPRFTLVLPGSGKDKHALQCSSSVCPMQPDAPNAKYARGAAPMLGVDVMFALSRALRIGIGLHTQLNKTHWKFSDGGSSFELGRVFWLPVTTEYRVRLTPSIELPLRALAGLAVVQAGRDLKSWNDAQRDLCKRVSDAGAHCTVAGPPTPGVIIGVGPGATYQWGKAVLRADLTLGYQWLRLGKLERSGPLSSTEKETTGTLIAALSMAVEI